MWIALSIAVITGMLAARTHVVKNRAVARVTTGETISDATMQRYNTMFGIYLSVALLALLVVAGSAEFNIFAAQGKI